MSSDSARSGSNRPEPEIFRSVQYGLISSSGFFLAIGLMRVIPAVPHVKVPEKVRKQHRNAKRPHHLTTRRPPQPKRDRGKNIARNDSVIPKESTDLHRVGIPGSVSRAKHSLPVGDYRGCFNGRLLSRCLRTGRSQPLRRGGHWIFSPNTLRILARLLLLRRFANERAIATSGLPETRRDCARTRRCCPGSKAAGKFPH